MKSVSADPNYSSALEGSSREQNKGTGLTIAGAMSIDKATR